MAAKKIKIIYLLSFLIITPTISFAGSSICYFSLNNEKEFIEMEKFTKKLNTFSKEKITIKEFLKPDSDPENSFEEMVKSGQKCDGLVISGHHTGSFGGKNARGSLGIDFLEKLSCQDKYKEFFNNIKGLWLQGCRTLGVGKIESYEDADFHTLRVGEVLTEDDLEQSFADLNIEFSATLDQENPLSSRYLRVFPRASVFGWTKTAPGKNAHSEYSAPFHIANMAKVTDDRAHYFDNPISGDISYESAVKYLDAINDIIGGKLSCPSNTCLSDDQSKPESAVEAWLRHGNSKKGWEYAFNNPDLNAYVPLFSTKDEFLKKAKELECFLKNTNDPNKILKILDEIVKNEKLIGYTYNLMPFS